MKQLTISSLIFLTLVLYGCEEKPVAPKVDIWGQRIIELVQDTSFESGSTFLSIYSQIYTRNNDYQYNLTTTVSMHNPNAEDSIYIDRALYYNTHGEVVRSYFDNTIFIRPMETVQIIIPVVDNEGGTGANFIFDWKKNSSLFDPLFEAVMVSSSSHSMAFVTEGKRLR